MAVKFGQMPTSFLPNIRLGDYEAFCLNEAVYMKGAMEESRAYKKMREEAEAERDSGDNNRSRSKKPDNEIDVVGNSFTGEFGGEVGKANPDMLKKYIAAGGDPTPFLNNGKSKSKGKKGAAMLEMVFED